MVFSIIIPVLNGEKYIGKCIDSIRRMHTGNLTVNIYAIDNGSSDLTLTILESKNVKYLVCKNMNVSGLRNMGASLVAGEFIGFVDADCLVDDNWMLEAISILTENDSIGIVGRFYDVGEDPTWVEQAWYTRRKEIEGPVDFIPAGNMVVRKSLFDKLDGFSENMVTGEDYELCQRVRACGYFVINSSRVNVKHLGNAKTLSGIIKKERWYALGMLSTLTKGTVSRPLLICFVFIILLSGLVLSLFLGTSYFMLMFACLLSLILTVSFQFTKKVTKGRFKLIIKFMPISFCYMFGRTIGLIDLTLCKMKCKM